MMPAGLDGDLRKKVRGGGGRKEGEEEEGEEEGEEEEGEEDREEKREGGGNEGLKSE